MKLKINDHDVFVSTGGQEFNPDENVLLFIHGSGQSHLTYVLQGRFLANRGWNVLTPDMPAHGHSDGTPLTSITDMADWYASVLDAAGVKTATVIGHSQGSLVAMELARRHGARVDKLVLMASGLAIPVNDALLDMAHNNQDAAIGAMMDWGHGPDGHMHDHTMPGQSHMIYGSAVMRGNVAGALFADLSACADYTDGGKAAASISCPTLCILAGKDKMTPIKAGRKMHAAIKGAKLIELPDAGHMLTGEKPFEVNKALREFLNS
ncbi:alpha/beta hydrolase [Amylibacter ulvae]|uniref:Alpha/beta hydrolase n=1 Tax=Paramylibacter ulvae TaxID=1651968 RepID=A0ABQ3CUI7_9RHOB|nr:alpha/beta hydrolase [Amylibacter ulvae]GHA44618.1 alpha/beta hydrolase [Amylibacter ulvae]